MLKKCVFFGKNVKIASIAPFASGGWVLRLRTLAHYDIFVEFVSNAKIRFTTLKNNYSKCSAVASSALLRFKLCSFC